MKHSVEVWEVKPRPPVLRERPRTELVERNVEDDEETDSENLLPEGLFITGVVTTTARHRACGDQVDSAGLTIRPHLASSTSAAAPAVRRPGGDGLSCDARQRGRDN